MEAGTRGLGVVALLLAGIQGTGCAPGTSGAGSAGGGHDGIHACTGVTVTPAGTTTGSGTFQCVDGRCADSSGAFTGTVDATTAYWVQYAVDDSRVRAVSLAGGTAATLYPRAWNLAVDPGGVYLTVKDGKRLVKVSHDGSVVTTVAQPLVGPWGVAVDATHVYWTGGAGGGAVHRLAR